MKSLSSCCRLVAVFLSATAVLYTISAEVSHADDTASDAKQAASNADQSADDGLFGLGIEQLRKTRVSASDAPAAGPTFNVGINTVAKTESTVGKSPAAIFVITPEMIRRSGCTSIPEVLRLVPGMDVARFNSHSWAISCRGFNGTFANKLLVLIDGRIVYNELFGGVYWDVQDLLLEDIARIEVIRGPGGALWGSNAVNGVINIITKKAQDTQGSMVIAGSGNLDSLIDGFRVGGNNGNGLYWRIYSKHFERGKEYAADGAHDAWRVGRGGFRVDWDLDKCQTDKLTFLGSYYGGEEGNEFLNTLQVPPFTQTVIQNQAVSGANILARWNHKINEESDWNIQVYFDREYRNWSLATQLRDMLDVEFKHQFRLAQNHKFIWGMEFRQTHDYLPTNTFNIKYSQIERTANLLSGFLHDEVTLVEDHLIFTMGTKLEHNSYSGFECQPSMRLIWNPDEKQAVWAAISRAVRIPTRVEENATSHMGPYPAGPTVAFLRFIANPDLKAEELMAYEIGYRAQATERFSWDITGFINVYENIIGLDIGDFYLENDYYVVPGLYANNQRARLYGLELTSQYSLSDSWRISSSYSYIHANAENNDGTDVSASVQGNIPRNQAQLQSYWDLGNDWEFDMWLRYVDNLSGLDVPAYITMDLRLGWRPCNHFEMALVGQNLLDNHHPEYDSGVTSFMSNEVRRTVYVQLTWRR